MVRAGRVTPAPRIKTPHRIELFENVDTARRVTRRRRSVKPTLVYENSALLSEQEKSPKKSVTRTKPLKNYNTITNMTNNNTVRSRATRAAARAQKVAVKNHKMTEYFKDTDKEATDTLNSRKIGTIDTVSEGSYYDLSSITTNGTSHRAKISNENVYHNVPASICKKPISPIRTNLNNGTVYNLIASQRSIKVANIYYEVNESEKDIKDETSNADGYKLSAYESGTNITQAKTEVAYGIVYHKIAPPAADSNMTAKSQLTNEMQTSLNDTIEPINTKVLNGNMYKLLSPDKKVVNGKNKVNNNNHKLTEYYPVRRSVRKTSKCVMAEKMRDLERAVRDQREDGLEVTVFDRKGRGIITTRAFTRGEFVVEYAGELVGMAEARERELRYAEDPKAGCYMYYFRHGDQQYCVDATMETGRLGRLVNHSRNGNLLTKAIWLDGPRLVLLAAQDISPGEEVTYDYGDRSKESLRHHPWLAL